MKLKEYLSEHELTQEKFIKEMEKEDIKLPEPIHVKNIHHKLDIFSENNIIKEWGGYTHVDTFFYLYLLIFYWMEYWHIATFILRSSPVESQYPAYVHY